LRERRLGRLGALWCRQLWRWLPAVGSRKSIVRFIGVWLPPVIELARRSARV
jgi:hypothetical protein